MRSIARALTFGLLLATASSVPAQPVLLPTPLVPDLTNAAGLNRANRIIARQFAAVEADRVAGNCPARDRRLGALQVWIAVLIEENTRTGGGFERSTLEEYLGRLASAWRRPCPPIAPPSPTPTLPPLNPFLDELLGLPLGAAPPTTEPPSPLPEDAPPESILDMMDETEGVDGVTYPPAPPVDTGPPPPTETGTPPPPPPPPPSPPPPSTPPPPPSAPPMRPNSEARPPIKLSRR